jgi:FtsZ-interacting cell division protein ZipA
MLNTISSLSFLTLMEIVGPIVLAGALVYGILMSRRRRESGYSDRERDAATRELYRAEDQQQRRSEAASPAPPSRRKDASL